MAVSRKILVTGGIRSGKSCYALKRACEIDGQRVFLATAEALDEEMSQKIKRHQQDREGFFQTIEEPLYLGKTIECLQGAPSVVVIDCLTVWINNLIHHMGDDTKIKQQEDLLIESIKRSASTLIMVTNEVGMGIVPDNQLTRNFINQLGFLNQSIAQLSDEVILMVSSVPQRIKGAKAEIKESDLCRQK